MDTNELERFEQLLHEVLGEPPLGALPGYAERIAAELERQGLDPIECCLLLGAVCNEAAPRRDTHA